MADEHHAHDDGEHHHHAAVAFDRTEVADGVMKELDALYAPLSEHLDLVAKYPELSMTEREDAVALHQKLEKEGPFTLGFHAEGDHCAVCEEPVDALFTDVFKGGQRIAWAAYIADLPVHPAHADEFDAKFPRPAPRVLDQARRKLTTDLTRPPGNVSTFWRHDVIKHGTFNLEDWADAVFAENEEEMDRKLTKAMDKLVGYLHERLYH